MPDEKTQPDSPSPAAPPTGSVALPPPDPERLKEVLRRRDVILASGQAPELLLVGRMNGGDLMYAHEKRPVVLLFTTPHAALDYIRVNKTACEVGQLKFDMLPAAGRGWAAAGAEKFALNRCPRCPIFTMYPIDALGQRDQFRAIWAMERATRQFQGEMMVRVFLQHQSASRPQARAALETIRDHINCSVPYVYEFIAFLARLDGDEEAKAAAIERLKEFGPRFADFDARWTMPDLAKSLATAMVGLRVNFGIPLPNSLGQTAAPAS